MKELDANARDHLVSLAKGVMGAVPYIGPLISEVLATVVPNLRLERVVIFLKALEEEVKRIDADLEAFKRHMRTEEGLDLFEEGIVQATRSVSETRKQRLARLVARSLTADELIYAESRKILNLYRELTDQEIIWLLYYARNPVVGPGLHADWVEQHPDVLQPISRAIGAPREQHERAAIQDSWKDTLLRLRLTAKRGQTVHLTTLGRLLVRYVGDEESSVEQRPE